MSVFASFRLKRNFADRTGEQHRAIGERWHRLTGSDDLELQGLKCSRISFRFGFEALD